MKRTTPQIPLKRKTPLRAKKGLNRMSNKAKEELKIWLRIVSERKDRLFEKFGFIPCERCLGSIQPYSELYKAEGHHLDRNRRNNSDITNCRIVHASWHIFVHDNNIKNIPSLL